MQHCKMFQTCIFRETFNKILMQCSHSKHVNMIQMWGYNCNKIKLVCIDAIITFIKTFLNVQKMENMNSMPLFMLKKLIFINQHVMCSLISSCFYNHLNSMFMNVKLIIMQLELNGIGYKLVFHNYLKYTSNTWHKLICKFEKYNQNPKKLHGYLHI